MPFSSDYIQFSPKKKKKNADYICFLLQIPVIVLFVARTIGAISGMMLWIVGYSTLAENIEKRHMGTASGVVSGAVAAGILAGPAVSGFFVEKVGYWFAWSLCFGLVRSPPSLPTASRKHCVKEIKK